MGLRCSKRKLNLQLIKIIYLVFFLNGLGILLPWNMCITIAPKYYVEYWFSPNKTEDEYGRRFMSSLGLTAGSSGFILALICASQIIRGPLIWRIWGSLSINILLVATTLLLAIIQNPDPKAEHWFFIVSLTIVLLLNASNGFYQNSIFGIAADFSEKYSNALMHGLNFCGVFTTTLAIITILAFPNDTKSTAILFFSLSTGLLFFCLCSNILVKSSPFYKYYSAVGEAKRKTELADKFNFKDIIVKQYWPTIKICWMQYFNILVILLVTGSIYPTILVGMPIPDVYKNTNFGNVYYDVTVFLNYNFFTLVGSGLAEFVQCPSAKFLWIPVLIRVLFVPYFMLCNYDPTYRTLPILFKNPWWWIVGNTLMAISSGYFLSLAIMYAPKLAPSHLQKIAGQISALCLAGGLLLGLGFNPVITSMVEYFH